MSNKKLGLISLGCSKNQVDLEHIVARLTPGFDVVNEPAACDLMIVNTCGFIRPAVEEAIEAILSAKAQLAAAAKLVVMGCMSERYKGDLARELPEVDFFCGVGEHEKLLAYVESAFGATKKADNSRFVLNSPYYAYLKISEGCNNRCSYCTIPSIRGDLKSIAADELLKEAGELVNAGAKEVVIVSQDGTKYGVDTGDYNLPKLLRRLATAFPDVYFRIMYLNPDGVTEELVNTVRELPNIVRYFDIPIQHASDSMLKRMNRKSSKAQIQNIFSLIRRELPEAFIRTTVIVGFPGETEADFAEIASFIQEYKPDFAGFFPYYAEEGTPAAAMPDQIDDKTTKKRLKALQSLQKKNTLNRLKQMKGEPFACFIERANDDFSFILEGRAIFQAPEVDGMLYVTDGIADKGSGPYKARINKIAYPDIYVELI